MLFLILETFRHGPGPVGARFRAQGRLMPADVHYVASWMDGASGERCVQLVEAPSAEALVPWLDAWRDLVDFEVVPAVPSNRFWASASAAARVEVRREALDSEAARALIAATNAELSARYPEPGATHFRLDPGEVSGERGAFLVAHGADGPLGCGAVRRLDRETVEIKRMYVVPGARGLGVGRRLLGALEKEARRLGARRVVLETGTRQREALGLYASAGYERIPPFGEYVDSPLSVCMAKAL